MKSKVYRTVITLAATALPPCALIAYLSMSEPEHEVMLILGIYLIAHAGIWLALIPAFEKFPRSSWILCTLLYPIIAFGGMLLLISVVNPYAFLVGLLWFGPLVYFPYGWLTIPASGMSSTIAYILTRNKTNTENTDRGTAAPAS